MTDEVLLPINSNAASMTAAPFNMVAIRMSWPGQSTNDTCLVKNQQVKSYGTVHKRYMPGEKSTNKYIWNLILFIIREFFLLNQIIIKGDKVKSCISLDEICEMEFTYKFILFNWIFFFIKPNN